MLEKELPGAVLDSGYRKEVRSMVRRALLLTEPKDRSGEGAEKLEAVGYLISSIWIEG